MNEYSGSGDWTDCMRGSGESHGGYSNQRTLASLAPLAPLALKEWVQRIRGLNFYSEWEWWKSWGSNLAPLAPLALKRFKENAKGAKDAKGANLSILCVSCASCASCVKKKYPISGNRPGANPINPLIRCTRVPVNLAIRFWRLRLSQWASLPYPRVKIVRLKINKL